MDFSTGVFTKHHEIHIHKDPHTTKLQRINRLSEADLKELLLVAMIPPLA